MGETIQKRNASLLAAKQGNVIEGRKAGTIKSGAGNRNMRVRTYASKEAKAKAVAKAEDDLLRAKRSRENLKTNFNPRFASKWVITKSQTKKPGKHRYAVTTSKSEVPGDLKIGSVGYVGGILIEQVLGDTSARAKVAGQSAVLRNIDTRHLTAGKVWGCSDLFKVVGKESFVMDKDKPATLPVLESVDRASYRAMWHEYLANKAKAHDTTAKRLVTELDSLHR